LISNLVKNYSFVGTHSYSLSTINFNAGIGYLINNQLQIDLYVGRELYEVKNFVGARIS